jgi:hypothetical protein
MNTRTRSLPALAAALVASLALGCSDIDNAADCNRICDRYRSCFDSSYNTSACYEPLPGARHVERRGPPPRRHLRRLHQRALVHRNAVFTCGAQCSSIVP